MRVLIATAFENSRDEFEHLAKGYICRTQSLFRAELRQVKPEKLLAVTEGHFRILLDEKGLEFDSVQFAKKLHKLIEQPKPVAFLIGGPDGHTAQTRAQADAVWSLSQMTLPHKLALCVLAEQIYRAGEITRGGPYHRA